MDAYIDFLCPFCRQFELSSADTLARLVAEQRISLAYHPMNFLYAGFDHAGHPHRGGGLVGLRVLMAACSPSTRMRCSSASRPRAVLA